jgi:diguanylate cyclase (GGDEF)-like protein/putative nucleotidyltransferase with HDIG domain
MTTLRRALWVLVGAWLVAWEVSVVATGKAPGPLIFSRFGHDVVLAVAAGLCVWVGFCAADPGERRAWRWIGAGVAAWTLGETYYTAVLWTADEIPIPSPADAGYLLFPPLTLVGTWALMRTRAPRVSPIMWVDGLIAALGASAVGALLMHDALASAAASGQALEAAVGLAYPLMDLVLLGVVVGALAATGWRMDPSWVLLALGIVVFWFADALYLVGNVEGTYSPGSWFDIGWWLGMVLIAAAAWRPRRPVVASDESVRRIVMPLVFGTIGLGVLVAPGTDESGLAVGLAAATLLALMTRALLTFRQNVRMLRASREEAHTDPLTGLGNRRALTRDLHAAVDTATPDAPLVLALFDLDGFKHYNDTFGHPAGDALLVRLSVNLSRCLGSEGLAFRMGGDEFCALIVTSTARAHSLVQEAVAALSEHGEGFTIGASFGAITLPGEAADATEALRAADQRMYAQKAAGRTSASRQSKDVLLRALAERHPDLGDHTNEVADLAEATARRLGLVAEDVNDVRHAAELHDVGKVAVPDAILNKPGPLDPDEWAFIRRHTIVGERIVAAAPALSRVATLVRASHERWDGAGYPDGLAGEDIPLGARIVAVADAFDAMTAQRPYGTPRTADDALDELRRCSGTQFDPAVVAAFCVAWERRALPLAA